MYVMVFRWHDDDVVAFLSHHYARQSKHGLFAGSLGHLQMQFLAKAQQADLHLQL